MPLEELSDQQLQLLRQAFSHLDGVLVPLRRLQDTMPYQSPEWRKVLDVLDAVGKSEDLMLDWLEQYLGKEQW